MSYVQIDRFEGTFAVCYNDSLEKMDVPANELPEDAIEGDVFVFDGSDYTFDNEETWSRTFKSRTLFERLTGRTA